MRAPRGADVATLPPGWAAVAAGRRSSGGRAGGVVVRSLPVCRTAAFSRPVGHSCRSGGDDCVGHGPCRSIRRRRRRCSGVAVGGRADRVRRSEGRKVDIGGLW